MGQRYVIISVGWIRHLCVALQVLLGSLFLPTSDRCFITLCHQGWGTCKVQYLPYAPWKCEMLIPYEATLGQWE